MSGRRTWLRSGRRAWDRHSRRAGQMNGRLTWLRIDRQAWVSRGRRAGESCDRRAWLRSGRRTWLMSGRQTWLTSGQWTCSTRGHPAELPRFLRGLWRNDEQRLPCRGEQTKQTAKKKDFLTKKQNEVNGRRLLFRSGLLSWCTTRKRGNTEMR